MQYHGHNNSLLTSHKSRGTTRRCSCHVPTAQIMLLLYNRRLQTRCGGESGREHQISAMPTNNLKQPCMNDGSLGHAARTRYASCTGFFCSGGRSGRLAKRARGRYDVSTEEIRSVLRTLYLSYTFSWLSLHHDSA